MIAIIDYGMGNLVSIQKAFKRFDEKIVITNERNVIEKASKLILPGVGNYKSGMESLNRLKLVDILNDEVLEKKKPVLGVCLGMQLFTNRSEEGNCEGLGWIEGETVKFNFSLEKRLKIPHIGWNDLNIIIDHPLLSGVEASQFYFVHSYYVKCQNQHHIVATTDYGIEFASVIGKENIFGTQFHPEKSLDPGLAILKKFSSI